MIKKIRVDTLFYSKYNDLYNELGFCEIFLVLISSVQFEVFKKFHEN